MAWKNGKTEGVVLALTAAVLWGVSGAFAQFLMERRGMSAEWLVTTRMLAAGGMMLAASALAKKEDTAGVWRNRGDAGQLVLFALFGMLAVQYTYFAAIRHSNVATATVLQFAGPVMIAVWVAARRRRWPAPGEAAAIGLAVAGLFLLVTHGRPDSLAISGAALFWGLTSAGALAFYSLQPAGLLRKHPARPVTGWAMVMGGAVLSFVHPPWRVEGVWDAPAALSLLFIIVLGTFAPFQMYLRGVRLVGGQTTSLLLCVEPLAAALVAVGWLKVPFGLYDWAGALCVMGTVAALTLSGGKRKAAAERAADPAA